MYALFNLYLRSLNHIAEKNLIRAVANWKYQTLKKKTAEQSSKLQKFSNILNKKFPKNVGGKQQTPKPKHSTSKKSSSISPFTPAKSSAVTPRHSEPKRNPAFPQSKSPKSFERFASPAPESLTLMDKIKSELYLKAQRNSPFSNNAGDRLYKQAQTMQLRKEKLRQDCMKEYSFKPKLALNTDRWLNNRQEKQVKLWSHQEVAKVSGIGGNSLGLLFNT